MVGVVVLNWNNYADTAACLASLEAVDYPNHGVYVVDNGSTDGSGERLAREFEWCTFVYNDENRGFAGGNNAGIERAFADGAEYVLLVNNDVVVPSGFLTPLVETAERNERVAAVSGVLTYADSERIWYAGGRVRPHFAKSTTDHAVERATEYETGFVTGALMLLPRAFVEREGGLNEAYFFGMEDKDLSLRAVRNGWKLLVNPRSRVEHRVNATSGTENPFSYYHQTRNRLRFASLRLSPVETVVFYAFFVVSRTIRFVQWSLRGRTDLVRATLAGIRNHLAGGKFRRMADFEGRRTGEP
jgi:GT2 family glycosyltransferase